MTVKLNLNKKLINNEGSFSVEDIPELDIQEAAKYMNISTEGFEPKDPKETLKQLEGYMKKSKEVNPNFRGTAEGIALYRKIITLANSIR